MTTYTNDNEKGKGIVNSSFTITNYSSDYALDCDAAAVAETNDVLASVIRELINQGILKGTVATA